MGFSHYSVMLDETVSAILPERGGIFVDGTAGGGGHSEEILKRLPEKSLLISLDRDDRAIEHCKKRLSAYGEKSAVVKSNYKDFEFVLDDMGIDNIDGIIWDLGVSSVQLDESERGFSYSHEAFLDMRMDRSCGKTAYDVVNSYPETELRRIISDWGEEKFAGKIAYAIVKRREDAAISKTTELADIIASAIPMGARRKEAQHPAKRTFQAIRIEVNDELRIIEPTLEAAVRRLRGGGRAAVITFHSLEDRIAKQTFKRLENPCTCPSNFPVCVCGKKPQIKILTKKPMLPSDEELEINPRSRSAKLRVVEKL